MPGSVSLGDAGTLLVCKWKGRSGIHCVANVQFRRKMSVKIIIPASILKGNGNEKCMYRQGKREAEGSEMKMLKGRLKMGRKEGKRASPSPTGL